MQDILEFIVYLLIDIGLILFFIFLVGLYANVIVWGYYRIKKTINDYKLYKAKTDKYITDYEQIVENIKRKAK